MSTVTNHRATPDVINYRPTHTPFFFEGGLVTRVTPVVTLTASYSNDHVPARGVAHMAGVLLTPNENHRDIAERMPQRDWVNMMYGVQSGTRFYGKTPDDVHTAARAEGKCFSNQPKANKYTKGHVTNSFVYDDDYGATIAEVGTDRQNAWRVDDCHLAYTDEGLVISG